LIVGGGVLVPALLIVLGFVLLDTGNRSTERPPQAAPGRPAVPPAGSPGSEAPPSSTAAPTGGASPGPAKPSPGRTTAPPREPDRTRPPQPRPEPRQVGPRNLDDFEKLLSTFCRDRGDRTALLLYGRYDDPRTGDWVCVRVVTFTPINLDDACRKSFGDGSQARQLRRGDARTWRCFDS
jgi:hypothetical protein